MRYKDFEYLSQKIPRTNFKSLFEEQYIKIKYFKKHKL